MAHLRLFPVALILVLVTTGTDRTVKIPGVEVPSWTRDLRTLGYPAHPSENFSKTFGVPPTKLAFADQEHLVATFISADLGAPSEHEGRPGSFRLRLHIVVFESKTGEVDTKDDWSTPNPNDGVVAAHDGKVIVRSGNKLTVFGTRLETLKETDTAPGTRPNGRLFRVFSSPSGRFLLLEFTPNVQREYSWMNADTLETVHSFSESLLPSSISDEEIGGWRRITPREVEFVIRKPDEPGRVITLPIYNSNPVIFVNQNTLAIEAGYSPIPIVRTDGTPVETITPNSHNFFSRVTPSAEGNRFAFTGSSIRNTSEILSPHQTWEYVQRVNVYDMSTHTFVGDVEVNHSGRNQDFPLALPPNGSMLAFVDGESLKVYRLPLVTEHRP
jgi:hypothetical protein